jgi:hypothetical protein
MNSVQVAIQPDGTYLIVEANGVCGDALDRYLPPSPVFYLEDQLRDLLRGFGLADQMVESGIREIDETGSAIFRW